MKKFEFNKLIRNRLPQKMENEGVKLMRRTLSKEEYLDKLSLKLVEEALEVGDAPDAIHLAIELADVLEVVYTIAKANGISLEDVEKYRLDKREKNGHFDENTYVHHIEVEENNTKVIDYLNDKYRSYSYSK